MPVYLARGQLLLVLLLLLLLLRDRGELHRGSEESRLQMAESTSIKFGQQQTLELCSKR